MNWTPLVVSLLGVVVVAAGAGAVAYTDLGGGGEPLFEEPQTESDAGGEGDIEELPASQNDTADDPFAFRIEEIDNCGRTCRDVTATVENTGNDSADGVTVRTHIFVGENSTDDLVWEETEDVGRLAAGESDTTTQRVELSLGDALTVQEQGGWITIVTTIESEEETVTISRTREVA